MGANVAKQVANRPKREIVGLEFVLKRHLRDLRNERIVASDHPLEKAIMREPVNSQFLAITWRSRKQQSKIAWMASGQEAPLQGEDQLVRHTYSDKPLDNDGIAISNDGYSFVGADDLVLKLQRACPNIAVGESTFTVSKEPVRKTRCKNALGFAADEDAHMARRQFQFGVIF